MPRTLLTLTLLSVVAAEPIRVEEPVPIGKPVREFRLPDVVTGKDVRLSDLKDRIVVVIFYSHTCTFCRTSSSGCRESEPWTKRAPASGGSGRCVEG